MNEHVQLRTYQIQVTTQFSESHAGNNVIFGRHQIIEIDGSLFVSECSVARSVQH